MGEHPFFKLLVGEWTAEGELTAQDGNVVKITEQWKGRVNDEGTLMLEGTRAINDTGQAFSWAISRGASGIYEAAHTTKGDQENTQRFEANVSEVDLTMELVAYAGDDNSKISVRDSFEGEARDTIQSKVEFTNGQGAVTLAGTIVHKRVKASVP